MTSRIEYLPGAHFKSPKIQPPTAESQIPCEYPQIAKNYEEIDGLFGIATLVILKD
jgi:hypothetical protein